MSLNSKLLPQNVLKCIAESDRKPLGKVAETHIEASGRIEAKNEKELQRLILDYLRLQGVRVVVSSRMDRRTSNNVGTPDLLFCFERKPVAFEVKMPGRHPTQEQTQMLHDMLADGWNAVVVHSLDEVIQVLNAVKAEKL